MERFRQDLGYGFRLLLRQPGVAIVAVLTLALGIGANVAMMSFAWAILFPSLPYQDPDRLVVVERWSESLEIEFPTVSFPALSDWKERNRVFSDFSVLLADSRNLTGKEGDPERLDSLLVSASLLPTLGLEPFLGRGFTPDDERRGAERTIILSYKLWQRRFGGDDEILGRTVYLDDLKYTVIGVLPAGLSTETLGRASLGELWLPLGLFFDELGLDDRKLQDLWGVVCRLEKGVGLAAASEDMARITRELAEEYPSTDPGKKTFVVPIREHVVGDFQPMVLALVATVVFVLFIACANLINLLLTRFVARQQEFAVRTALGAGRRRLILQGLIETLALALVGGLIGLAAASLLIRVLPAVLIEVPHTDQAGISPSVLGFTILLCLAVTLIIGLAPALQMIQPSWQQLLTGSLGSRSRPVHRRLRQTLIAGELALAFVLLTGTGLALATYRNLQGEDLGFSPESVLALEVALPKSKYGEVADWTAFFDEALDRVSTLPGVEAAAVLNALPMGQGPTRSPVLAGDRPIPPREARSLVFNFVVSPDFFEAMDIRLVEGRALSPRDDDRREANRVIVISQSLARRFWPDKSAIGRKVGFEFTGGTMEKPEVAWREVVGVAGDIRPVDVRTPPPDAVYVSYTQRSSWDDGTSPQMALVVRTATEPASLAAVARSALLEIDSSQPVYGVRPLQEIVEEQLRRPRMVLVLLSLFAGLALILSLVGIYGVVSYMVAARTREIGVRMALGATPLKVLARLMLQNLVLILLGIGTGLLIAAALMRLMTSQLYGVDPMDPAILLGGCVVLAAVALLATFVPAFQAARVDPSRSLRYE